MPKKPKPTCPVCRSTRLVPQYDERVAARSELPTGIRENPLNGKVYAALACTACGIRFEIVVDPSLLTSQIDP